MIGCFAIGDTHQRLHRKDLQALQLHGKNSSLKKSQEKIASKMAKGFTILSQDESIFTADSIFRKKMRAKRGTRPAILVNGNISSKDDHLWGIGS